MGWPRRQMPVVIPGWDVGEGDRMQKASWRCNGSVVLRRGMGDMPVVDVSSFLFGKVKAETMGWLLLVGEIDGCKRAGQQSSLLSWEIPSWRTRDVKKGARGNLVQSLHVGGSMSIHWIYCGASKCLCHCR